MGTASDGVRSGTAPQGECSDRSAIPDDDVGGLDILGPACATVPYLTATLCYPDGVADKGVNFTLQRGTHTSIPRIGYFSRSPDSQIVMQPFVTMDATFTPA